MKRKDENTETQNILPQKTDKPKKSLGRNRKKVIFSAAMTALFVVAVIVINIIASVLTDRYAEFTADFTASQAFQLTDDSVKLAQSLKKDVEITFLCTKDYYESLDAYCIQTTGLAAQYSQYSDRITVNYVDIVSNPTYTEKYSSENLSSTDVIISCGDKYRVLTYKDMYNMEAFDSTYQYIASSKAEQAFDSAIMNVTADKTTKVTLVVDNAAEDKDYFTRFLESNNYSVTEITLAESKIPEDTELLVLFTPNKDYTATQAQSVLNFLTNSNKYGKNAIYIPTSENVKTPNIDAMLAEYGMQVEAGLAFDMDTTRIYGYNYYDGLACSFASSKFTDLLNVESDYPVIISYARPISVTNTNYVESLLSLSSQSGMCPFDADEETWDMKSSITGNVIVGAVGERGLSEEVNSHFVVMGSPVMFTQTILGSDFSDDRYLLGMFGTLCGNDLDTITIADKTLTEYDLNMSNNTKVILGTVFFALLPLIVLGVGLIVFLKRRNQ